jgi:hypothetical protein
MQKTSLVPYSTFQNCSIPADHQFTAVIHSPLKCLDSQHYRCTASLMWSKVRVNYLFQSKNHDDGRR